MFQRSLASIVLVVSIQFACGAHAATTSVDDLQSQIDSLQRQIDQLQKPQDTDAPESRRATADEYNGEEMQQQIDALRRQLDDLKGEAATTSSAASFNPEISLILAGTYANLSQNPEDYSIPGIALGPETSPGPEGLSLAESELVISANIDDWFYGRFTGAITPDNELEVEEAFVQTSALPANFVAQVGRFYSELGYLNSQHSHQWDFVDQPLIYRAFLANQYRDDGAQLRWLAPTNFFLEFGGEVFRGDSYPAGGSADQVAGTYTAFVSAGNDVGISHSWKAGLSYMNADADPRATEEDTLSFVGTTELYTAYLVWKWAPHGNSYDRNFKFQTAFMRDSEDGVYTSGGPIDNDRYGWYGQFLYQFVHGWRAAFRVDAMHIDNPGPSFTGTVLDPDNHDPTRFSVMVDYSHSEFSRLRFQYNRDDSQPNTENEFYLQYIMSLGAHGAHRY